MLRATVSPPTRISTSRELRRVSTRLYGLQRVHHDLLVLLVPVELAPRERHVPGQLRVRVRPGRADGLGGSGAHRPRRLAVRHRATRRRARPRRRRRAARSRSAGRSGRTWISSSARVLSATSRSPRRTRIRRGVGSTCSAGSGPVTTCSGRGLVEFGHQHHALLLVRVRPGDHREHRLGAPVDRQVRDARGDVHEVARSHLLAVHEALAPPELAVPADRVDRRLVRLVAVRLRAAAGRDRQRVQAEPLRADRLRRDARGVRQALPSLVALAAADDPARGREVEPVGRRHDRIRRPRPEMGADVEVRRRVAAVSQSLRRGRLRRS